MQTNTSRALALACGTVALVGAGTAATGALAGTAASPMQVTATLTTGQERPAPKGTMGGSGRFTGTLSGTTLKWTITSARLSGTAAAAHLHLGKRAVTGPVAVALCGPCGAKASGTARLTVAQLAALRAGGLYVNVHTAKNPAGEIRGQLAERVGGKSPLPTKTTGVTTNGATTLPSTGSET